MKYQVVLLIVGVLVEAGLVRTDKDESAQGGSFESKQFLHDRHKKSKSLHETAKAEDGTTVNASTNFHLSQFKLSPNESVYLNYNESAYYYGIWSYKKHISLLYASKENLVGVYNSSSESLLMINSANDQVSISVNVTIEFTRKNLAKAFLTMYELMIAENNNNHNTLSVSVGVFFNALLKADSGSECENCDFIKCLTDSFGKYVREIRETITKGLSNLGSGIVGGISGIGNSVGEIGGNVSSEIGGIGGSIGVGINGTIGDIGNAIKNGLNLFGTLFTPFFTAASTVASVFATFFGTAIQNAVTLPRALIQLFSTAIGSGAQFLNFDLLGQLNNVVRSVGLFFNNANEALAQIFLGGGIRNLTSGTIRDGDKNISINSLITDDNNWLIRIGGNANLKMTINYNSEYNLFAFYNRDLNISIVFNGNSGFYSVYNTTSGVGLIISQLTGNAKLVVDKTGKIQNAFNGHRNFTLGFILIGKSIDTQSGGLNNLINLDSNVFSLRTVMFLLKAGFNIDLAFLGKPNILNTINTNFNKLFNAAHQYFQKNDSGFDLSLGPLNILIPVLNFTAITNNFVPLIRDIFSNLSGRFNPALIIRAASTFAANLATGIGKFVFGALQFALNSVRNFTGGIRDAIRQVLGGSSSTDTNVTVGSYSSTPRTTHSSTSSGGKKNCTCQNG